jgi:hypothetical protein
MLGQQSSRRWGKWSRTSRCSNGSFRYSHGRSRSWTGGAGCACVGTSPTLQLMLYACDGSSGVGLLRLLLLQLLLLRVFATVTGGHVGDVGHGDW